jgi:predicted metal-dependent hydrolase
MPRPSTASARDHSAQLSLFDAPLDAPLDPVFDPSRGAGSAAPAGPPALASHWPHPRASRELRLNGHRVAYELRRARRRGIGFVVWLEGLSVSAPRWVSVADIEMALRERGEWIVRKLGEQRERRARLEAARIQWGHGALVPFLGRRVSVVLDPQVAGAILRDGMAPGAPQPLHVGLPPDAAPQQIRDAVQSWLQRQARRVFEERCAVLAPRLGVRVRRLALSSAATRWGSANANGSIRLHWRLIHFALPVIDYVATHELAHLREMNHSAAFWSLVRTVLPDFEHARSALDDEPLPAFE